MEDNRGKPLIENANENRNQLIEDLNKKIAELENIILDINSEENKTIGDCIKQAKQENINYVPDRDVVQEFLQLKGNLYTIQEKLQSLSLTEDTIFNEDEYLIKAEELLGKIDTIIGKKRQEFIALNKRKLEEASDRKIKIQVELSNSEIELNHLNLEKEELEKQIDEIEKGIIYRIKSRIFNKRGNSEIEEKSNKIAELEKKKRELETKISKLKMQEQVERFVPSSTACNDDQNENKEEKEYSEVEK